MNNTTDINEQNLKMLLSYKKEPDYEAFYEKLITQIKAQKQRRTWTMSVAFFSAFVVVLFLQPQEFTLVSWVLQFFSVLNFSGGNIPIEQLSMTATFALLTVGAAFTLEKM